MRILIDEALGSKGQKSGIGTLTVNLARHLKKYVSCDITEYRMIHRLPRYIRKWAYIGAANIPSFFQGYDVIHHVNEYVPRVRGKSRHILTVNDLSVLYYPETIPLVWRYHNRKAFKKSVRRADAITAISESVRDELLKTFPELERKRVFVSTPGVRTELLEATPSENDLDELQLRPFSYFLFVGELHRRKNLPFLLQAFITAKERRLIEKATQLVVVGKPSFGYSEVKPLLREESGIREMGYLEDRQIAALYKYCKALVYPSVYEGFGIPIIEAMVQNAPIVVSRIPTSIELDRRHGEQMFSFELGDQKRLLEVLQLLDRDGAEVRKKLSYGDLSRYSYDNVALEHVAMYRSVCETVEHSGPPPR